jgi:RNA polymerase sigma factor (sigma-70 family)
MKNRKNSKEDVPKATIVAAQGGDRCAFDEIVQFYQKSLIDYVGFLAGSRHGNVDVEDIVVDTLVVGWHKLTDPNRSFDPDRGSLRAYLQTIALHLALRRWKKDARTPCAPALPAIAAEEDQADKAELRLRIDRLPLLQRAVVLLYLEEYSREAGAASLGITQASYRGLLARATARLKAGGHLEATADEIVPRPSKKRS